MKIVFDIEYRTEWGEDLRVRLSTAARETFTVPLQTRDGVRWKGEFHTNTIGRLVYSYAVFNKGVEMRREYQGIERSIEVDLSKVAYHAFDSWRDIPAGLPFYSSAFFTCEEEIPCGEDTSFNRTLQLKVIYPHRHGILAVVGNNDAIGNWNPSKALPLMCHNYPEWSVDIDADSLEFPMEYKFVAIAADKSVHWEINPNRVMASCGIGQGETLALSDLHAKFDLPCEKHAGVAVPLFSLKSSSSCGIGDFGDLPLFVDWAEMTGMKFIQLLPVNDTTDTKTWKDSYPYAVVSVHALHPIYINPGLAGALHDARFLATYEAKREELNALPKVDYEAVLKLKLDYLSRLFEQDYEQITANAAFKAFCNANSEWLRPYVSFCCLRDMHGTADFMQWGRHSEYAGSIYDELAGSARRMLEYHSYLQYVAHIQLSAAVSHARRKGIVLKGDIPIGVSRRSADVWANRTLFHLDVQAGAPPDAFSADGQNWGFPTYNWQAMEEDGYAWWRKRLEVMSRYFDAYRIDHILGFFRIWEIPLGAISGVMGHFNPALPLSIDELRSRGFDFDALRHASPCVTDDAIARLFGLKAKSIRERFFKPGKLPYTYEFAEHCNTGEKIMRLQNASTQLKSGLMALMADVLFIEDTVEKSKYHPRICANTTFAYSVLLNAEEKKVFDEIYEDFYYRRHNDFWRENAMRKLPPLVQSTKMLACAEDLGMIPSCVPEVLASLEILSLEVQRMPKAYGMEFGNPQHYPYFSVCTTSTHDTSTLRGWWIEDERRTARYYGGYLGFWAEPPKHATKEICEMIIRQHLESNSMLCIIPFQDWLSISDMRAADVEGERINDPSDPNHYWRYRINIAIEDLRNADDLNSRIKMLVDNSGRKH